MPDKTTTDAEWKAALSAFEYKVLRNKGTEPRGGEYDAFYPKPKEVTLRAAGVCTLYSARPSLRAAAAGRV